MNNTSGTYDLAIDGKGWFTVSNADGDTFYTRAGSFNTNGEGRLVTSDGYPIEPAISVPDGTTDIEINETGQVYAKIDGQDAPQLLGQLHVGCLCQ